MRKSESIVKIAPALLAAQKAITFAAKDAQNAHLKNTYADLSSVIEAIKPALNTQGIMFVQTGTESDDGKLHLTTSLIHDSGEFIEDTLVMPLPKQDPQGYGSAMTYARRYALAAITGLYQDDDDGNAGSGIGANKQGAQRRQEDPGPLTGKALDQHVEATKKKVEAITDPANLDPLWNEAAAGLDQAGQKRLAPMFKKRKADLTKQQQEQQG